MAVYMRHPCCPTSDPLVILVGRALDRMARSCCAQQSEVLYLLISPLAVAQVKLDTETALGCARHILNSRKHLACLGCSISLRVSAQTSSLFWWKPTQSYRMAAVENMLWLCSKAGGGTRAVLVSTQAAFMICVHLSDLLAFFSGWFSMQFVWIYSFH